jgi:hypothetical protein
LRVKDGLDAAFQVCGPGHGDRECRRFGAAAPCDLQKFLSVSTVPNAQAEHFVIARHLLLVPKAGESVPDQGIEPEERGSYSPDNLQCPVASLHVYQFVQQYNAQAFGRPVARCHRQQDDRLEEAEGLGHGNV